VTQQRLQKVLAAAGIDSRRKCEELILNGAVTVNSHVVDTLPVFVDPEKDVIAVHGKKIRAEQKVYFLLNKPKSVICTNSDPQGRKRAIDFVPCRQRIFCVGRLDADTAGLIILTNDSELANKLMHPRYKVPKTYLVRVRGYVDDETVEKLKKGAWLAEGKIAGAAVEILSRGHQESLVHITIRQGLNWQIRKILARVGLPVRSLRRTRIGSITDRGLSVGGFRELTKAEVAYLRKIGE